MSEVFSLATVEDYTSVHGEPQAGLAPLLPALLARASRIVRDELASEGHDLLALIRSGQVRADTAADVVVDMVAYASRVSDAGFSAPLGATQASMTAGPYTQAATFTVPAGTLSFTRVHRKRLGLACPGRAFEVDMLAQRQGQP